MRFRCADMRGSEESQLIGMHALDLLVYEINTYFGT